MAVSVGDARYLDLIARLDNQAGPGLQALSGGLEEAEGGAGRLSTAFSALQSTGAAVAGVLAVAASAAIGFGTMAVREAIEFESSFAGVIKTVDGVVDEFGNLTALGHDLQMQMRDLALTIPVDTTTLNRIAELGGQLGIAADDLQSFTSTMAMMSVTTNVGAEQAAMSFAKIGNVMHLSVDEMENFASSIVAVGNNFATTESDLLNFANRMSGFAAQTTMSLADVVGLGGAITSIGMNAGSAANTIGKALVKMTMALSGSEKELGAFTEILGVTNEEFQAMAEEDTTGVLIKMAEGLKTMGRDAVLVLKELGMGNNWALRTFMGLANNTQLLRNAISLSNKAWDENIALVREANLRFKTTESRIQLLKNVWADLQLIMGLPLLEPFSKGLDLVTTGLLALRNVIIDLGEGMNIFDAIQMNLTDLGFSEEVIDVVQRIVREFVTFGEQISIIGGIVRDFYNNSIAPFLRELLGAGEGLASFFANFISIGDILTVLSGVVGYLAIALGAFLLPVIFSVVAAVAPLIIAFTALTTAVAFVRQALEGDPPWEDFLPPWLVPAAYAIERVIDEVANAIATFIDSIQNGIEPLGALENAIATFVGRMTNSWAAVEVVKDVFNGIENAITSFGMALDIGIDPISAFGLALSELVFGLGGTWDQGMKVYMFFDNLANAVMPAVDAVTSAYDAFVDFFSGLAEGESAVSAVYDLVMDLATAFNIDIGWANNIGEHLGLAAGHIEEFFENIRGGMPVGDAFSDLWAGLKETVGTINWSALGADIWGWLREKNADLGEAIGVFVGNVLTWLTEKIDEIDWSVVGSTLMKSIFAAVAIPVGLGVLMYDRIKGFVESQDWATIGRNLIQSIFSMGAEIGEGVGEVFTPFVENIKTWVAQQDWSAIGQDLWQKILNFASTAGETTGNIASNIMTWLSEQISNIDWSKAGELVVKLLVGAIGLAIAQITIAWTFFDNLIKNFDWDALVKLGDEVWLALVDFFSGIGTGLKPYWDQFVAWFSEGWQIIKDRVAEYLQGLWDSITTYLSDLWDRIKQPFVDAWNNLVSTLKDSWEQIKTTISDSIDQIVTTISDSWEQIKTTVSEKASEIWQSLVEAWEGLKQWAAETWDSIKLAVALAIAGAVLAIYIAWENAKTWLATTWETIKTTAAETWETIKTTVAEKIESLKETLFTAWETIKTNVTEAVTTLQTTLTEKWESIRTAVVEKIEAVKQAFFDFTESVTATSEAVQEFDLMAWLSEKWQGAIDWLNSIDWYQIGYDMMDRLIAAWDFVTETIPSIIQGWSDTFVSWLSDTASEIYDSAVEWVTEFVDGLTEFAKEASAEVSSWPGKIWEWITSNANRVYEAAVELIDNIIEGLTEFATSVYDEVSTWPDQIYEWITEKAEMLYDAAVELVTNLVEGLTEFASDVYNEVSTWPDRISAWVTEKANALYEAATELIDNLIDGLTEFATSVYNEVSTWPERISNWITEKANLLYDSATQLVDQVVTGLAEFATRVYDEVSTWPEQISGWIDENVETIKAAGAAIVGFVVIGLTTFAEKAVGTISAWVLELAKQVGSAIETLKTVGSAMVTHIVSGITENYEKVTTEIATWPGRITAWVSEQVGMFLAVGDAIAQGIAKGIGDGLGYILGAIENLILGAKDRAEEVEEEGSPAKLFIPVGEAISQGVALGITQGIPDVLDAMTNLVMGINDKALEKLGQVMESINSALIPAVSALNILSLTSADTGVKQNIKEFFDLVDYLLTTVGEVATSMSGMRNETLKIAEVITATAAMLNETVFALQTIGYFRVPESARDTLMAMVSLLGDVVLALGELADEMQGLRNQTLKYVEIASAVSQLIPALVNSLKMLAFADFSRIVGEWNGSSTPLADQIHIFRNIVRILVLELAEAAIETAGLNEPVEAMASAVSSVADIIEPTIQAMQYLSTTVLTGIVGPWTGTTTPLAQQIQIFRNMARSLMRSFAEAAVEFGPALSDQIVGFTDAITSIVELLEPAIEGMTLLSETDFGSIVGEWNGRTTPLAEQMKVIRNIMRALVRIFEDAAFEFYGGLDAVKEFTDSARAIIGLIIEAMDVWDLLAEWKPRLQGDLVWAADLIAKIVLLKNFVSEMVKEFREAADEMEQKAVDAVTRFTDAASSVMSMISEAIDAINLLQNTNIKSFSRSDVATLIQIREYIVYITGWFEEQALDLEEETADAISRFTGAAADLMGMVADAIDSIVAINAQEIPPLRAPQENIVERLSEWIQFTIEQFTDAAYQMGETLASQIEAFSAAAGAVLELVAGASSAIDAIVNYTPPEGKFNTQARTFARDVQEVISALVYELGLVEGLLTETGEVATAVYDAAGAVLGVVADAVDAIMSIGTYASNPALESSAKNLAQDLVLVVGLFVEAFNAAFEGMEELLVSAGDFADSVKDIIGVVDPAIGEKGALRLLSSYTEDGELHVKTMKFTDNLILITDELLRAFEMISGNAKLSIPEAAEMANALKDVFGSVSDAIKAINGIINFNQGDPAKDVRPISDAKLLQRTYAFTANFELISDILIDSLDTLNTRWSSQVSNAAGFAASINKIVSNMSSAINGLAQITLFDQPDVTAALTYLLATAEQIIAAFSGGGGGGGAGQDILPPPGPSPLSAGGGGRPTPVGAPATGGAIKEVADGGPLAVAQAFARSIKELVGAVKTALAHINSLANMNIPGGVGDILNNILTALVQEHEDFWTAGANLGGKFKEGFLFELQALLAQIPFYINQILGAVGGGYNQAYTQGYYVASGFAAGINNNAYLAARAARNMAQTVATTVADTLRIASDSKVFGELADYSISGYVNQFKKYNRMAFADPFLPFTQAFTPSAAGVTNNNGNTINLSITLPNNGPVSATTEAQIEAVVKRTLDEAGRDRYIINRTGR